MIVFVMRVGLIGEHPSSYNLFKYSLFITQNLDVFFFFLPHCLCPEILMNKHHRPKLSPCLLKYTAKQGHNYPGSSKFFTAFSLANYSKIDLELW